MYCASYAVRGIFQWERFSRTDDIIILITSLSSVWMDGPMGGVDPDQVENDSGGMWRALYKLEKTFSDNPNPLKMAQKVK